MCVCSLQAVCHCDLDNHLHSVGCWLAMLHYSSFQVERVHHECNMFHGSVNIALCSEFPFSMLVSISLYFLALEVMGEVIPPFLPSLAEVSVMRRSSLSECTGLYYPHGSCQSLKVYIRSVLQNMSSKCCSTMSVQGSTSGVPNLSPRAPLFTFEKCNFV